MSKRKGVAVLAALILLESVLVTFADIFFHYAEYYNRSVTPYVGRFNSLKAMLAAAAAVALGMFIARCIPAFLKQWPADVLLQPMRADRICSEFLLLLLLGSGIFWAHLLWDASPYSITYSFRGLSGVWEGCAYSVPLLFTLAVFYGSLTLLVRQWRREILPETMLIWRMVRRYRYRTSLERRLQNRRRAAIILSSAAFLAGLFCAGLMADYFPEAAVVMAISVIVLFIAFLRVGGFGRLTREAGCLAQQIQCMSDGTELPEKFELGEKAILYEPSLQLKNIESAMRQSVEKQVQAERLKIDLITNVSHDLKTPLTSMVGYTDLLKKEELSAEARDYVDIISTKQEQLKNMIQDLFDLSKATSGADQISVEILDMRRLLEQTLADMEDAVRASGREIRTDFAEEPLLFSGDNNKMYRVVQNLLGNALKYSLDGTRIYLSASRQDSQVELQIKNIASYEMDFSPDEITERFVRGDKSRTTEGHGLGLAIASSFVRNMGGTLKVGIDGDLFKVTVCFPCMPG